MTQRPMSSLGTSAQQATEAFQGLQGVSKDLADLEIVIPAGHTTDPEPFPARPGYMDISEYSGGVRVYRITPVQEPDIDKVLSDLFREPWYKRLWSWLATSDRRPFTDHDLQAAAESLDLVLRLPLYKRIPSLILWLWRLP